MQDACKQSAATCGVVAASWCCYGLQAACMQMWCKMEGDTVYLVGLSRRREVAVRVRLCVVFVMLVCCVVFLVGTVGREAALLCSFLDRSYL